MGQYDLIIKMLNERFDRLEFKVDDLQKYKWRGVGFSAGIVAVFSLIGLLAQVFIGR